MIELKVGDLVLYKVFSESRMKIHLGLIINMFSDGGLIGILFTDGSKKLVDSGLQHVIEKVQDG